jgi:hypothetical protein
VYFWDAVRVLVRRWWVFAPALVLSAIASIGTYHVLPAHYRGDASVLFLMPPRGDGQAVNPYLDFGGSLYSTADVVSRVLMADDMIARIRAKGDATTYAVSLAFGSSAPIVSISVLADDPALVKRTINDLLVQLDAQLSHRESASGAPRSTWIRTTTLSKSSTPVVLRSTKVRGGIAVFAFGLVIAAVATFLVEGRAGRRDPAVLSLDERFSTRPAEPRLVVGPAATVNRAGR